MLDLQSIKEESDIESSGTKSSCYVLGDKAYLSTNARYSNTLRYKFEVWKELGKLCSIERYTDSWGNVSIVFVLEKLEPLANCIDGEWIPLVAEYDQWLQEKDNIHLFIENFLQESDYHKYDPQRETRKARIQEDLVMELATNPNFPSYNQAFIALINAGMVSKFNSYMDDHGLNFMVDPVTRKVLPIDIFNI